MALVNFAGFDPTEVPLKRHAHGPIRYQLERTGKPRVVRQPSALYQMQALFRAGNDTAEIAKRLKLSEAKVYNRLAKAKERAIARAARPA